MRDGGLWLGRLTLYEVGFFVYWAQRAGWVVNMYIGIKCVHFVQS